MENIINTQGTKCLDDLKREKAELDAEYNAILKVINQAKSKEEIEACQSKLVILFEKYQILAENLKKI